MEGEITPHFRSMKSHISEHSFSLPEEIIEEILSRLPVKSLLKFRCVSKPWRDLIGSKRFIKKHLYTSTENPTFAHHNIIINSIRPQRGLKQRSLLSMLNDPLNDQFTFCDLENVNSLESICIVGCFNGLFCILSYGRYFTLWNPSTKKTKNLPAIDHRIKHGHISNYGFGFDDLSGDYMVFGIASFFWSFGRYEAICKVYSLQTNSWKKVKRGNVSPFNNEGKFASGKMHWRGSFGMDWDMIISFDLRSEVDDVIDLPVKNVDCYKSMGVLGGSLSLLCAHFDYLDIWVIKEYGVKGCWEKVATVPYLDSIVNVPYPSLLALGPNGEVLLSGRSAFGIYYPEGNGFRQCKVTDLGDFHGAFIYVESLVPL